MAITEADFNNGPIVDHGKTVSRTPVTTTQNNITGHKEYTDASAGDITVVWENNNTKYSFNQAGLTKGADARMFFDKDQAMNKNDKITYDSLTYRVDTISTRFFGANAIFKIALLFLIA